MNIPFFMYLQTLDVLCEKKIDMYNILSETKKIQNNFNKTTHCSIQICAQIPLLEVPVPKFIHMPFNISVNFLRSTGSSAGFFPDKTWSISPQYKKRLEFYPLTELVNCHLERTRQYPL